MLLAGRGSLVDIQRPNLDGHNAHIILCRSLLNLDELEVAIVSVDVVEKCHHERVLFKSVRGSAW